MDDAKRMPTGQPPAAADNGALAADAAATPRQPAILLVDDDAFMLSVQTLMLRSLGYEHIRAAPCGADALRMLATDDPAADVIVCDLNMPGMDGIEFLQAVSALSMSLSVILLSGEGTRVMHTVQKLLGAGKLKVLGALEKPATRDELHALLQRWKPGVTTLPEPLHVYKTADLWLAARHDEWVLHYQPKVDLKSGAIVGVEALVRWRHPSHGLIYPDRFIGVAEDCGAIQGLTYWVCREALRQQMQWRLAGRSLKMAINVSMENLRAKDFAPRLAAISRDAGAAPQDVVLEVTESRLMAPESTPLESLVRLRLQRFGLSIDDFGTGHSSLAQLRDVPFTELKVDRSFVSGARNNAIIRPMLEGSIGIARRLGMQSVAEGVETADDWNLMREIDCDLAQGYFVARPMPAEQMLDWCDDWKGRVAALM